ncbi:CopG family transcriptional regulator [Gammaproteobacteria bacterium]
MSIPDLIKTRLTKDRPMTTITLRIPVDVVESLKDIAPKRGFSGYQALLKSYLSEGLRRDEAQFAFGPTARLIEALKKRGVAEEVLAEAARELEAV